MIHAYCRDIFQAEKYTQQKFFLLERQHYLLHKNIAGANVDRTQETPKYRALISIGLKYDSLFIKCQVRHLSHIYKFVFL